MRITDRKVNFAGRAGVIGLKSELTPERKLCDSSRGECELYVVDAFNAPATMHEIGRLRELAFRDSGGGTGKSEDIDEYDLMDRPYHQLVVWNPGTEEILGGYRFIYGWEVEMKKNGQPRLASAHIFDFSEKFIREYLPFIVELGRSFVIPECQSKNVGEHYPFALDNLWDGLAAIVDGKVRYYFGKMTIYPDYPVECRDLLLHFFGKHFPDNERLLRPYNPLVPSTPAEKLDAILCGDDFDSDYRLLKAAVRKLGCRIPPMINTYMRSASKVTVSGTAINDEFFNSAESSLLIRVDDVVESRRHNL